MVEQLIICSLADVAVVSPARTVPVQQVKPAVDQPGARMRIKDGQIVDKSLETVRKSASEALDLAANLYPTISSISPDPDRAPEVGDVLAEIEKRKEEPQGSSLSENDIPF